MTFLASKTLDFSNGQAGDAHTSECFTDFVKFERFDDGGDLLHEILLLIVSL
jgi:hypothetical protein